MTDSLLSGADDANLPPPPYPADVSAKGWRFEIDVDKVRKSDTWMIASAAGPEYRGWLLLMWMTAWDQVPCGSFSNDDTLIAMRLGMPLPMFVSMRHVLMRGWRLHADGRLYHDTISSVVQTMLNARNDANARKRAYDQKTQLVRERDGGACVYCGARKYLSLDHLIAVSRGGSGDESNLVTACRSCNSRKGARTPDEAGMSFLNKQAEALWVAIRDTMPNAPVRRKNRSVTRYSREGNAGERGEDNTSTGTSTSTSPRKTGPAAPDVSVSLEDLVLQEGIDPVHAASWLKVRKDKRLPLTAAAWEKVKAEAVKAGITPAKAVQISAEHSWGGFAAHWLTDPAPGHGPTRSPTGQPTTVVGTPDAGQTAAYLTELSSRPAAPPPRHLLERRGSARVEEDQP